MATLHRLLPPARVTTQAPAGHSAQIIIFPGVRYERMADPGPAKKPTRRRRTRVKRDHMVIPA
jgi:hypothetical protein